jgi:hypothetical protein
MLGFTVILGASSLVGASSPVDASSPQGQKKKKKVQPPPPPPLPSGPTGQPVQQIPLDSIAAVPPQVSFQNSQLTIVAPNSTLADILRAVRKLTGAEIDIPPAPERVVTHLGPGPARAIVAELLNGSRFNYVLLGSPADETVLTRVVLVAKSGPDATPGLAAAHPGPAVAQANNAPEDTASDAEAEAAEENMNADEAPPDQPTADAEQPANNGDQPAVKTPQQMLQEMQQRQMQLQQQQQQGGQVPGSGMPPHPPQEQ